MKSQKGITIISLTIYLIVMAVVIGIVSLLTTFFYKNVSQSSADIDQMTEYTTFNTYFTDEINQSGIKILECQSDYVVFSNGVQYSYIAENKGIYRDRVKICRNIESCSFTQAIQNEKTVIKVNMTIAGKTRSNTYTLRD